MGDPKEKDAAVDTPAQALSTVADGPETPALPPQAVKLSREQFFELKSGRLEIANAVSRFTMAKRELEIAGQDMNQVQAGAAKFEDEMSKKLGLPAPITLRMYELDEPTMSAVIPQKKHQMMAGRLPPKE